MKVHKYHGEDALPFKVAIYIENKREHDLLLALSSNIDGATTLINSNSTTPFSTDEVQQVLNKLNNILK